MDSPKFAKKMRRYCAKRNFSLPTCKCDFRALTYSDVRLFQGREALVGGSQKKT